MTSRKHFLAALGGIGLLGGTSAGLAALRGRQRDPGRVYPAYAAETAGGWIKEPMHPVLGGELGTCFDVCVLRDNSRFRLWFSWRPMRSIALVESSDGIHWSRPVIVLRPGDSGSWEQTVNRPCVVKSGGQYHLWYTGQTAGSSALGYAVSADGVHWTRSANNPVLQPADRWERPAVMACCVCRDPDSSTWRMWYSGGDQYEPNAIGHAVSKDGQHWLRTSSTPIFQPAAHGSWDGDRVTAPQVLYRDGWYVMFYIGFYNRDSAEIGLARSRNGISGWQRHPANPIIRPALRPGSWDYSAVYRPWALPVGDRWMLWYNGRRGDVEQIGLAEHAGLDLGFTRSTD